MSERPGIASEREVRYHGDAWYLHDQLLERFTRIWEVRPDLVVCAPAWDRGVELKLIKTNYDRPILDPLRISYHTTGKRNISTMRELALALLEACDFVEANNPGWAER